MLMVKDLIGDLESIDKGSVVERLGKWTKKRVDTTITNDLRPEPSVDFSSDLSSYFRDISAQQQQMFYTSQPQVQSSSLPSVWGGLR